MFTEFNGKYTLYRERISFSPDSILKMEGFGQHGFSYSKQLARRLRLFIQKMGSLEISDVSCEFRPQGIDIKIHLKSKGVVLYVSERKIVVNEQWRKYLASFQKLDEHWYYAVNDS